VSEKSLPGGLAAWQKAFLEQHQLTCAYLQDAQRWFTPLAEALAAHHCGAAGLAHDAPAADRATLVGVNGSQGSGKTTLCAYLCALLQAEYGVRAIALSLDDFYLPRAARRALGMSVHPLLATRGVPGTHDMALLNDTLDALLACEGEAAVAVPRFDKAQDDRRPVADWEQVEGGLDLVLLEGWCLGVGPQDTAQLLRPVNPLEKDEDPNAFWREYVNDSLRRDFLPLYQRIDCWVMLQAPSFDCIYRWRLEQEQKLAGTTPGDKPGVMSDRQLARFIQHYQRLTEHGLATVPATVDYLYTLDDRRSVVASRPDWGPAS
jgi:D-glycerate 3-kinase